jgi:hypothetical protein
MPDRAPTSIVIPNERSEDDCMDAGGSATLEAKAEGSPSATKCPGSFLNRCAHFEMTRVVEVEKTPWTEK